MYRVKLRKEAILNHFKYDKVKYLIGVVIVSLVWAVIVNASAPKVPADKKIDIYLAGGSMAFKGAQALSEEILAEFPDLLEVNFESIELEKDDYFNKVNTQKLLTRLHSKSGDIFVFLKEDYINWAYQGAFVPVEHIAEDLNGYFDLEELDELITKSRVDNKKKLYGLPLYENKIFSDFYDVSDSVISIVHYSKNKEKAEEVIRWIIEKGALKE